MIGQILKLPFPYVQKKGFKIRPALIINEVPEYMFCAAISSNGMLRAGDVYLEDWRQAGLVVPSKVKVLVLTTFSKTNLNLPVTRIGFLSKRDLDNVMREFAKIWQKGGLKHEQPGIAI